MLPSAAAVPVVATQPSLSINSSGEVQLLNTGLSTGEEAPLQRRIQRFHDKVERIFRSGDLESIDAMMQHTEESGIPLKIQIMKAVMVRHASDLCKTIAEDAGEPPTVRQDSLDLHERIAELQGGRPSPVRGYPPLGWSPVIGALPASDSYAEGMFQIIYEDEAQTQIVGLLAEPSTGIDLTSCVITSPGAGAFQQLASRMPQNGIAVLLVHCPEGNPGENNNVKRTVDHIETLARWFQTRVQQKDIQTLLIGWSAEDAVVVEVEARAFANIMGVGVVECSREPDDAEEDEEEDSASV